LDPVLKATALDNAIALYRDVIVDARRADDVDAVMGRKAALTGKFDALPEVVQEKAGIDSGITSTRKNKFSTQKDARGEQKKEVTPDTGAGVFVRAEEKKEDSEKEDDDPHAGIRALWDQTERQMHENAIAQLGEGPQLKIGLVFEEVLTALKVYLDAICGITALASWAGGFPSLTRDTMQTWGFMAGICAKLLGLLRFNRKIAPFTQVGLLLNEMFGELEKIKIAILKHKKKLLIGVCFLFVFMYALWEVYCVVYTDTWRKYQSTRSGKGKNKSGRGARHNPGRRSGPKNRHYVKSGYIISDPPEDMAVFWFDDTGGPDGGWHRTSYNPERGLGGDPEVDVHYLVVSTQDLDNSGGLAGAVDDGRYSEYIVQPRGGRRRQSIRELRVPKSVISDETPIIRAIERLAGEVQSLTRKAQAGPTTDVLKIEPLPSGLDPIVPKTTVVEVEAKRKEKKDKQVVAFEPVKERKQQASTLNPQFNLGNADSLVLLWRGMEHKKENYICNGEVINWRLCTNKHAAPQVVAFSYPKAPGTFMKLPEGAKWDMREDCDYAMLRNFTIQGAPRSLKKKNLAVPRQGDRVQFVGYKYDGTMFTSTGNLAHDPELGPAGWEIRTDATTFDGDCFGIYLDVAGHVLGWHYAEGTGSNAKNYMVPFREELGLWLFRN
jgi:hypothetical protein